MKTHKGSCHCGAIQFEAELDLHVATRCNCRICTKTAIFGAQTKPELLRVTAGEDTAGQWVAPGGTHFFCKRCGVQTHGRGDYGRGPYASVNVNCLDDLDPSTITAAYFDGRHNNWEAGTASKPWPFEPGVGNARS